MKRRISRIIIFLILISAAIFIFTGCSVTKKYTVYTYMVLASSLDNIDDFENGTFVKIALTDSEFSKVTQNSDDYKHLWTLDELIQYFVGVGFDSTTASSTAAWLTSTVEHGEVLARSNPYMYMIVK